MWDDDMERIRFIMLCMACLSSNLAMMSVLNCSHIVSFVTPCRWSACVGISNLAYMTFVGSEL